MMIIRVLLSYVILCNLPVFAWQVSLQQEEKNKPIQVVVSNDQSLQQVDLYLVWFDKDNAQNDPLFISWVARPWPKGKWQKGLQPIFTTPLDIEEFSPLTLSSLEPSCPQEHRCFLAFVATLAGHDPSLIEDWQASSILPLSLEAGQDRLPGQKFFLPTMSDVTRSDTAPLEGDGGVMASNTDNSKDMTLAPSANKAESAASTETEKPDIFKVVGSQVLYANSAAERFQIIDITDPAHLQLLASSRLAGSPLEIYTLGTYYILLQSDYFSPEAQTHLSVMTLDSQGKLVTHQEISLPGQFKESRRRGELIYTVTETFVPVTVSTPNCAECSVISSEMRVNVNVFQMTSEGNLQEIDKQELSGYSPQIAIFPDYLAIATSDSQQWNHSQVFLFDLTQSNGHLKKLPMLSIPGRIPSEFHMDVNGNQFRVVYGPKDLSKDGSSLAIYNLSTINLELLGQVNKIAPGEDLFATRFVDDRAFVVTYERKDPLWVLDLANPRAPKILGELEVPGWSEKLFFNKDRLFAVGIDDQPLETEEGQWVRRVALSLFDVSEPTQPSLISKFVPLAGQVTYSYSLALQDERALLLDWDEVLAALPLDAWENATGAHLQIISLLNNQISDAGLLESPVSLQRSASIGPDLLAALGDQALYTVRWGLNKKPEIVGELELAKNISWLNQKTDQLFAAGWGNQGLYRLYSYRPEDLETPVQNWQFSKGYTGGILTDDHFIVFYDYNPLTVQAFDVESGKLYPPQALEVSLPSTPEVDMAKIAPQWYNRTLPLLHEGWIHVAEQQAIQVEKDDVARVMGMVLPMPPDLGTSQWVLRSWKLFDPQEIPARSIPGQPLAFTNTGHLITYEATQGNQLRLNLLSLETDAAKLISSRDFDCRSYSPLYWVKEALYVRCDLEDRYGPIVYATSTVDDAIKAPEDNTAEEVTPPSTLLLKLDPQGLTEVGSWKFSGYRNVQAITSDLVLLSSEYGWYRPWIEDGLMLKSKPAIMPPLYQDTGCDVYQLTAQPDPLLLKHLETCPNGSQESIVLTSKGLWVAEGFKGITQISW